MKNILISIIVPIYNSEKYLESFFTSIDNQKYENYELILVNDGSKDKSEQQCQKYLKKNNRSKYYYKDNSGVSDTRNYGIKKAKGDYICFVDSDDIISEDFLLDFIDAIDDKTESIICCKNAEFVNEQDIKNVTNKSKNIKEFVGKNKYDLIYTEYSGYATNKLFKRNTIINNNIFFNQEIGMCEDLLFVFSYLKYVKKIICIEKINYYYRISKKSASKSLENEKWFSIFKAYDEIKKDLRLCSPFFTNKFYYMYNYYIQYAKYRSKYIKNSNHYIEIKNMINQKQKVIKKVQIKFTLKQRIKIFFYKFFNSISFKLREGIKK